MSEVILEQVLVEIRAERAERLRQNDRVRDLVNAVLENAAAEKRLVATIERREVEASNIRRAIHDLPDVIDTKMNQAISDVRVLLLELQRRDEAHRTIDDARLDKIQGLIAEINTNTALARDNAKDAQRAAEGARETMGPRLPNKTPERVAALRVFGRMRTSSQLILLAIVIILALTGGAGLGRWLGISNHSDRGTAPSLLHKNAP